MRNEFFANDVKSFNELGKLVDARRILRKGIFFSSNQETERMSVASSPSIHVIRDSAARCCLVLRVMMLINFHGFVWKTSWKVEFVNSGNDFVLNELCLPDSLPRGKVLHSHLTTRWRTEFHSINSCFYVVDCLTIDLLFTFSPYSPERVRRRTVNIHSSSEVLSRFPPTKAPESWLCS